MHHYLDAATTPHEVMRLHCVDALYNVYLDLEVWNNSTSPANLERCSRQFLQMYTELSYEARRADPNTVLWSVVPNIHLLDRTAGCVRASPKL